MQKRLLIFHPVIAPYRIDFFNTLSNNFVTEVCLLERNLSGNEFEYREILKQLDFVPLFMDKLYFRKSVLSKLRFTFYMLSEYHPDIVMVSECGIVSLAVVAYRMLFRKKYKIVSIIDDSYDMLADDNQFSRRHVWAEKILVPHFDEVICVEPRVVEYFQRRYKKGVYFPIIQAEKRLCVQYQDSLKISEEYIDIYNLAQKKILLFVGRLVDVKNLRFAIQAFVEAGRKDTCFVIVGKGTEETDLRALVKEYDNVLFVGRKEGKELFAWYNLADVFILPSLREPFGAVTNEALIGGCQCLISQRAGSSCLIENGINGYTFNPTNMQDLKEKMNCLLDSVALHRQRPVRLRRSLMQIKFQEKSVDIISTLKKI